VQLDNGVTEHWGEKWNIYAGFSATKTIERVVLRVGAAHLGAKCQSDNRFKVDVNSEGKSATWYNRTVVTHDKFTFGFVGAYSLFNHVLVKNNLLFGYKHDGDTSAYLRLLNDQYRKTGFNWADASGYFDSFKLDLISSFKNWKYGIEVTPFSRRQPSTPRADCSTTPNWSLSTSSSAILR
jgi:hypothetical protein